MTEVVVAGVAVPAAGAVVAAAVMEAAVEVASGQGWDGGGRGRRRGGGS